MEIKPSCVEQFRNIVSVKSNVVSMEKPREPGDDPNAPPKYEEVSIFEVREDLDRGPDNDFKHCCEVKTVDRIVTLYTHDIGLLNKFSYYL